MYIVNVKYTKRRIQKRERRMRCICLIVAFLAAACLTGWLIWERGILVSARTEAATESLAEEVLRFHVLADSDSFRDQEIKMQVKEAVVDWLREHRTEASGKEETKAFLSVHLDEIEALSERVIRKAGSTDTVTAEIARDRFPEKTYGALTFPAGEYEALRIRIGSGRGHNWWCCLYPGLCFTGALQVREDQEEVKELENLIDGDAFSLLTGGSQVRIRWFFLGTHKGEY